jgi:hypothetical protein
MSAVLPAVNAKARKSCWLLRLSLIKYKPKVGRAKDLLKRSSPAITKMTEPILYIPCSVLRLVLRKFYGVSTLYCNRSLRPKVFVDLTAFGLFTPISLGVSFVLAEIIGASVEFFGGKTIFVLIGAFLGAVLFTTLLSFFVCSLALRVTRLSESVEQSN